VWPFALLGGWEVGAWLRRRERRSATYDRALRRARELRRPLVVVGAPDGGVTAGYGPGDLVVDVAPSSGPWRSMQWDICDPLPWPPGCCVVFCSCVLEYVRDVDAAIANLSFVSGGELFVVTVEPWSLAAHLYPNAKRVLPPAIAEK